MSDDLRTRIATAVWMRHRAEAFAQLGLDALAVPEHPIPNWAYGMADAVIRELRLRKASRPNDYGYVDYPSGDRYITKWIDSQTNVEPERWGCGDDRCKACH